MRREVPILAAIWLSLVAGFPARADEAALAIVAIPGLFGMEATVCGRPVDADPDFDSAAIDRRACAALSPEQRVEMGRLFAEAMRTRFANVVDDPRGLLVDGGGRDLALNRSVFASLHVARIRVWTYDKPGGVVASQTHIGLRLLLTNALTGQVIYVKDYASESDGQFVGRNADARITQEIAHSLPQAITDLVTRGAADFNPYALTAQVVGQAGADYVVASGLSQGVHEGDLFNGDVSVVFADANYAIVRPLLSEIRIGQSLTRQVAQPVGALSRPSILAIVAHTPPTLLRSELLALVEARLTEAGFATAPINPNFVQIRDQAFGGAGVQWRRRALPDYFVRVSVDALYPTEGPDVRNLVAGQSQRLQEAWAFLEVVDRSGRVVFSTTGRGRVEDRVFADLTFPAAQRQQAAIVDALQVASRDLAARFHPAPARLPAQPEGDLTRINDVGGALSQGVSAQVLRRVGRMRGVDGDVWRPIGAVEVVSTDATGVLARSAEVEPVRAARGDVVAYHTAGNSITRRRFAPCVTPSGQIDVDWMTDQQQTLYPLFAVNGFSGAFRGPVFIPGLDVLINRDLGQQFDGLDHIGAAQPVSADVCFQPVHSAALARMQRTRSGADSTLDRRWGEYDLIMGYRLMQNGQRVGGTGVRETMRGQEVAVVSGPEQDAIVLQMDLAMRAAELSRRAAAELAPPP